MDPDLAARSLHTFFVVHTSPACFPKKQPDLTHSLLWVVEHHHRFKIRHTTGTKCSTKNVPCWMNEHAISGLNPNDIWWYLAIGQKPCNPSVHIKIAGKWIFFPMFFSRFYPPVSCKHGGELGNPRTKRVFFCGKIIELNGGFSKCSIARRSNKNPYHTVYDHLRYL